jgi:hypothetical protein
MSEIEYALFAARIPESMEQLETATLVNGIFQVAPRA